MKYLSLVIASLLLAACQQQSEDVVAEAPADHAPAPATTESAPAAGGGMAMGRRPANDAPSSGLSGILASLDEDHQSRYQHRHPQQTLEFFGIEPGMTVIEGLPGGGWYSKILLPYLGSKGCLIGLDYNMEMWPLFNFATEEFIASRANWPIEWPAQAREWRGEGNNTHVDAHTFGTLPESLHNTADAALMIRAFHNLSRFEDQGHYMSMALTDIRNALKPGGILGVVQHRAPENSAGDWARGQNGYLKQTQLIERLEAAGFEFIAAAEINANPKDQPGPEDFVWRLPPSLDGSDDDPEQRSTYESIGESDRMTLKFRKPLSGL